MYVARSLLVTVHCISPVSVFRQFVTIHLLITLDGINTQYNNNIQ